MIEGIPKNNLDLTLISHQLTANTTWNVIQDCGNSDHYSTRLQYNVKNCETPSSIGSYQIINLKKADWRAYHDSIMNQLSNKNLNITNYELIQIINIAVDESVPSKTSSIISKVKNVNRGLKRENRQLKYLICMQLQKTLYKQKDNSCYKKKMRKRKKNFQNFL
ncbi:hypothetical protein HHI36_017247 [Cryptolaemus montrouzieri]|uniref:Uncharacterized protein n=1 Tax=Cryptolaemus montrouzieri TaxID=559131 RepID=A0ABD2NMI3_9CUCU